MTKHLLLLFLCCSIFVNAIAQKQNNYYFKNNGAYVNSIDSAAYIRVVQEPEKGSLLYPVKEYYRNENKKSIGYSYTIEPPTYEGRFISFYSSGIKKQVLNYSKGKIIDTAYTYYPNGQLYTAVGYQQLKDSAVTYVQTVRDSTGKNLVTNGNGFAIYYDTDFSYITEKGSIKNGKPDGDWVGQLITKDTISYKETFAEGMMLSGESTDGKGNVYHYVNSEIKPLYKSGPKGFFRDLATKVRYPRNMVSRRTQGVVQISFIVRSTGEMTDVHAINDALPELAAEAIRAIKTCKEWEPGMLKGRKVDVPFVVPMSFTLGY